MTRMPYCLPFAMTLAALATPALAGPPITTQGPGDGDAPPNAAQADLSVMCDFNGEMTPFIVYGDRFWDVDGRMDVTVTRLDEGVYFMDAGDSTLLLTESFAQISGGANEGKYDCVLSSDAPAAPDVTTAPGAGNADHAAELAALQQRLDTARIALEASQEDLISTIIERDRAQAGLAAAEGDRDAAQAALAAMQAERDTARAAMAALQEDRDAAQSALAEAQRTVGDLQGQLNATLNIVTARNASLAEAEATIAALQGDLAAALAAAGTAEEVAPDADGMEDETAEDAAESDAMEDSAEAAETLAPEMAFDADAAMAMLEGAELSDIARAALTAAIEQARDNPDMAEEVMARLNMVLGQ